SIAGCSMGALVGGIYAAGKLDEYTEWSIALGKFEIFRLLDPAFGAGGLLKGERIINTLRELLGDCQIEELPLKFTAVATDIDSQEEVWIEHGSLFDAIRASIAIPTVFTPFTHDGRRLLDGGLVNPLPVEPVLQDDTDLTIAVSLSGRPEPPRVAAEDPPPEDTSETLSKRERVREFLNEMQERFKRDKPGNEKDSPFDLVSSSIETMQNTIAALKLETTPPDVMISVPRNIAMFYEFHRAAELTSLGHRLAAETLGSGKGAPATS
ncbi:MAG: serine protease, partial [Akkermansiaceae bacterium]|nr:serine protease [Akkermansiaceae bacterium]